MSPPVPRPAVLALLGDAKAHPEQDWLEDNGDALDQVRGELIRCQLEVDRLPAEAPARAALARRARALQQQYERAWLGSLQPWLAEWACHRGLLSISVPVGHLCGRTLPLLTGTETWAWVEELYVVGAQDADLARLRTCPLLAQLGALGFQGSRLSQAGARTLGQCSFLTHLHTLDLSHCPLIGEGVRALVAGGQLGHLRHLDLASCGLQAGAICHLEALERLERLILWGNLLGDGGAARLASCRSWPRLAALDLRGNQIGEAGGTALAGWPGLAGLRELLLTDNQLGPAAAQALAGSRHLERVESLVLWGNPVGPDGADQLRKRFGDRVHVSTGRF